MNWQCPRCGAPLRWLREVIRCARAPRCGYITKAPTIVYDKPGDEDGF